MSKECNCPDHTRIIQILNQFLNGIPCADAQQMVGIITAKEQLAIMLDGSKPFDKYDWADMSELAKRY